MLRARFPLAIAALASAIALVPATSASAASAPTLPGLPSQVQDALDQLGGAGGSGTPDVGGALTDLTGCLAESAPTTPPTTTQNDSTPAPSVNSLPGGESDASAPTQRKSTSEQSPAPSLDLDQQGLTTQSASDVTVLAAGALDPISDPLDEGQQCLEDFLADLGAVQAKCFSENNFTIGYLTDKLEEGLAGTPPSTDDLEEFQNNLTGLLACLQAPPSTSPPVTPDDSTPSATPAPVTEEAPAAVAVTGTPTFTG